MHLRSAGRIGRAAVVDDDVAVRKPVEVVATQLKIPLRRVHADERKLIGPAAQTPHYLAGLATNFHHFLVRRQEHVAILGILPHHVDVPTGTRCRRRTGIPIRIFLEREMIPGAPLPDDVSIGVQFLHDAAGDFSTRIPPGHNLA